MMPETRVSWPDSRMRTSCLPPLQHFKGRIDVLTLMVASPDSGLTVQRVMYTHVHSCLIKVLLQSSVECADQPSPVRFSLLDARSITDKPLILNDLFMKESPDVLLLTETSQQDMDHVYFEEIWTAGISIIVTRCLSGCGRGLSAVYRLTCRLMKSDSISSFTLNMIKVGSMKTFYCILIYRPSRVFSAEFSDLSSSVITLGKVVILRYFNLHIDGSCNSAVDLITESLNFKHHVSGPTHIKGHTLDLAFSLGLKTNDVCVKNVRVRDHSCIFFSLSFVLDPSLHKLMIHRWIINQDPAERVPAFFDANMTHSDVHTFILSFNNECKSTFNTLAPLKQRIVQCSSFCIWKNEHINYFRRYLYKLEHLWKASKLQLQELHVKELGSSLNFVSHNIPHAPVFLKSECNKFFHCFVIKPMINRLKDMFGNTGDVLKWLMSYLSGRSFSVSMNQVISETTVVPSGIPQGSVLGPITCLLHVLPLDRNLRTHSRCIESTSSLKEQPNKFLYKASYFMLYYIFMIHYPFVSCIIVRQFICKTLQNVNKFYLLSSLIHRILCPCFTRIISIFY